MRKKLFNVGQWFAKRRPSSASTPRRRSAAEVWTGLEALEERAMLSAGPTITSVTASPSFTIHRAPITITANGITSLGGDIKSVTFYLDTNGNGVIDRFDHLLGKGKPVAGTSAYSITVHTTRFPVGSDTVLAVATDTEGNKSTTVGGTATIISHPPHLSRLTVSSTSVAAGNNITLSATGVKSYDHQDMAKVDFYYDSNNNGVLDGADRLLGSDSSLTGGWKLTVNAPSTLATSGLVRFFAVATDVDGQASLVASAIKFANAPPVVTTLTAVSTPTPLVQGGTANSVALAAAVTDSDGIKQVKFFFDTDGNGVLDAGDATIATATGSTFTTTAPLPANTTAGVVTYFAVATDKKGATGVPLKTTVNVTGNLTATSPPGAANGTVPIGGVLTLSTPVTLNSITAASVQFFIDSNNNGVFDATGTSADTLIGTGTPSADGTALQFAYTIPATTNTGSNTFFSVAKDGAGTASPALSIHEIVVPAIGTATATTTPVPAGGTETLSLSAATTTTGKSVAVEFFADTNGNGTFDPGADADIGAATLSGTAYTLAYTVPANTVPGNQTFFAVVKDGNGVSSVPAKVSATISGPLTATSGSVPINSSLTLTTTNLIGASTTAATAVDFYVDSNGNGSFDSATDAKVGTGVASGNNFQLAFTVPPTTPTGNTTFFAVNSANPTAGSNAVRVFVTPSIGTPTVSAPSTSVGVVETLGLASSSIITTSSIGATPAKTVRGVKFFVDTDNNSLFDPTIDTDIGAATLVGDNWQLAYTPTTVGNLRFFVVATDSSGIRSPAGTVSVTVASSIATLTATPSPAPLTSAVTFSASTPAVATGTTVQSVKFYYDANKNGVYDAAGTTPDTLIGTGTLTGSNYVVTYTIPLTTPTGNATFFAVATDSLGHTYAPKSVTVAVTPLITSLVATPSPVARGSALTLTTQNIVINANATITRVDFYSDTNNSGVFDATTDTKIGTDTVPTGGQYQFVYTVPLTDTVGNHNYFAVVVDSNGISSVAAVAVVQET